MLPPIPEKLWKIDDSTVDQHFSLLESDRCYYIWEYTAGRRYDFSPTNQLISNLKIKPSVISKAPKRNYYKQEAIRHSAQALRHLVSQIYAEHNATFVPIPGSKAAGNADHDDRMLQVLQRAFYGWTTDMRSMLKLTKSTQADHETPDRLSFDDLLAITQLKNTPGKPPRPVVVLVDDVLNSGKHFKVGQTLICSQYPDVEIRGLFLARCVRDAIASPEEFPMIDLP